MVSGSTCGPSPALAIVGSTEKRDGPGWPHTAEAQHASASRCAMLRRVLESEPDLCSGQVASPVQHALRASGVDAQSTQVASSPTRSARLSAPTGNRRGRFTAPGRMLDGPSSGQLESMVAMKITGHEGGARRMPRR